MSNLRVASISLCSLAEVLKVSKPVQSPHRWALNRIAVNDTEANNYLRKESKMMMGALRTVEDPSLPLEALSCLPDHHDHPTQLLSQIFHAPPDCVIGSGRLRASPGDTRLSFLHHLIPYDPVPPPTRLSTHCPLCLLLSLFERFAFQLLIYHTFTISQDQCRHSPLDFVLNIHPGFLAPQRLGHSAPDPTCPPTAKDRQNLQPSRRHHRPMEMVQQPKRGRA